MTAHSNHLDADGKARMVDVTEKPTTTREAIAAGVVTMNLKTAEMIRRGDADKGDVLGTARIAAIQATKQTAQLIPLCHPIPIESVTVDFQWPSPTRLRCQVQVRTSAKTGVEMEALSAVAVACLTIYDMVKSIDRGLSIGPIGLESKRGGKSGVYQRSDRAGPSTWEPGTQG
jgi:cyclic pyranopterin phosphate synthase